MPAVRVAVLNKRLHIIRHMSLREVHRSPIDAICCDPFRFLLCKFDRHSFLPFCYPNC